MPLCPSQAPGEVNSPGMGQARLMANAPLSSHILTSGPQNLVT